MARLSKTSPFQIYNDDGTAQTPERSTGATNDDSVKDEENYERPYYWPGTRRDDGFVTESDDEIKVGQYDGAQEGDDEKNYTRTSISSMPESNYPTDHERTPMHKPYTPTYSRPSVRRLQMSSPLRKGKVGTPHSEPRGSPRTRRKGAEFDDERESKQLPLVLLHITVLPMNVPWSTRAMREILPQHIFDNMQLLKSKLSDTLLKRGILIPHPGDDYELLEEKLLEALELQDPRISKCGHYRARDSTSSTITTGSDSNDSGMGSSVDGSDEDHCNTCHHHLQAAGSGKQKWSVKVFAANGLMRASAWSAAWSEMERVDVEIMPWMKDEMRIRLDERKADEFALQHVDHDADERRVNQIVEERLRLLEHDAERAREAEMAREIEQIVMNEQRQHSNVTHDLAMAYIEPAKPAEPVPFEESASTELPDIYRPKDIPLSILLRNYIFLLVRKRWNTILLILVAVFGGLLSILGPVAISREGGLWTLDSPISVWTKSAQDTPSLPELGMPETKALVESQSSIVDEISIDIDNTFDDATEPQDSPATVLSDSHMQVDSKDLGETTLEKTILEETTLEETTEHEQQLDDLVAAQDPSEIVITTSSEDSELDTTAEPEMPEYGMQDKCLPYFELSEDLSQCMIGKESADAIAEMEY